MIKKLYILSFIVAALAISSCEKVERVSMQDAFVNADDSNYDCDGNCGFKGSDDVLNGSGNTNSGSTGGITDPNQDPDYDGIVDPDEDEDFDKDGK